MIEKLTASEALMLMGGCAAGVVAYFIVFVIELLRGLYEIFVDR